MIMRTVLFLVRKEFLQIFRHRILTVLIFLMPIVQLIILANAADYEVQNISLHLIDHDLSAASRRLAGKFEASPHFILTDNSLHSGGGLEALEANRADLFIEIPPYFERTLLRENAAGIQVTINAINGLQAGIINGYTSAILNDFNRTIQMEWQPSLAAQEPQIEVRSANWFNPELNYQNFMVPGILVILVTLIGMFLCSINIVKEKEVGTIEQINVTPIRKYQFIIGKLLPFLIIALLELAFGLFVGKLLFNIPIVGDLTLLFSFAFIYLLVVLGLGLLISTFVHTQQQAMFISWFVLIIFILLSGLFTPIESMPAWAQKLTLLNPTAYFIDVIRLLLLKGSRAADIQMHFAAMGTFALIANALAILNYRKQNF